MYTLVLIALGWGALIAFGVSLVVALVRRRPYWRLWGALAAAEVAVAAVFIETGTPIMEDGPFHGRPRRECPTRPPDQTFPIHRGYRLEAYDPVPGEEAPTVRLRDRDGGTAWCVFAVGNAGTRVASVRFTEYQPTPFRTAVVVGGAVRWTFGHEAMWWYVGRWGGLRSYYYSW